MDVFSNFVNNFNVMLIVTLVIGIFGGIAKVFGMKFCGGNGDRVRLLGDRVLK